MNEKVEPKFKEIKEYFQKNGFKGGNLIYNDFYEKKLQCWKFDFKGFRKRHVLELELLIEGEYSDPYGKNPEKEQLSFAIKRLDNFLYFWNEKEAH